MEPLEQAMRCRERNEPKKAHVVDQNGVRLEYSLSEEVSSLEVGVKNLKISMDGMLVGPGNQSSPNILHIVVERHITLIEDVLVLCGHGPVIGNRVDQLG